MNGYAENGVTGKHAIQTNVYYLRLYFYFQIGFKICLTPEVAKGAHVHENVGLC